jgi:FkbM family methyltransferase
VVTGSKRFASTGVARGAAGRQLKRVLYGRCVPAVARFAFRPGVHPVNDIKLLIPASANTGAGGEHHMALGTYEMDEMHYVLSRLQTGGGMVDVGAHIGYYAIPAAARVGPTGRVIAIEPTASSAETLRTNVALNGFVDRVTVIERAASDHSGFGQLRVSRTSAMWNTLEPDTLDDDVEVVSIPTTTIDDVLEGLRWPPIHVIKLDVEGHERRVLIGAARTLARYPDAELLFEASGTSNERLRVSMETISFLGDTGFHFCVVDRAGRPRVADIGQLEARMHMPRWEDSLFNVVARRS